MTRFAPLSFLALLALAGLALGDPAASAVKVSRPDKSSGSGVVVWSKGGGEPRSLILTNRHVSPSDTETDVTVGGRVYEAKWLGIDPYCDLAALEVKASLPAAPLADKDPPAGTPVTLWSHPDGWRLKPIAGEFLAPSGAYFANEMKWGGWRPGMKTTWREVTEAVGGVPVTQLRECYDGPEMGDAKLTSVPGCSGGAVWADGKVVGLCWGGHPGTTRLVRLAEIKAFVEKHKAAK